MRGKADDVRIPQAGIYTGAQPRSNALLCDKAWPQALSLPLPPLRASTQEPVARAVWATTTHSACSHTSHLIPFKPSSGVVP
eukprot:1157431-Pelagomonas_calceolata.AAC.1